MHVTLLTETPTQVFSREFLKLLRTPVFTEYLQWLLLYLFLTVALKSLCININSFKKQWYYLHNHMCLV